MRVRIGVLASGSGTNLEAILAAGLPVAVVVVDRPCRATDVAAGYGVPWEVVARRPDRVEFTHAIVDALEHHGVELVAMAGFMTILEKPVFDVYAGKGVPEGKKSVALTVTLQPVERTLTDAEIEAASAKIVAQVAKATGATLRG